MKRLLVALVLVFALIVPVKAAESAPLMRNVMTSCAFGAGVLAVTTYYALTPALATGSLVLPVTEVIAANAIIGCGIGVAGAAASTVVGWVYDVIF
ncbi:MAG: hypothetical protein WCK65_04275 [Rhodospirillaceae bacterium]